MKTLRALLHGVMTFLEAAVAVITGAFIVAIGALFACAVVAVFVGLPVWLLWGYFAPIFGLPALGFFESIGLYLLIQCLFGHVVTLNNDKK